MEHNVVTAMAQSPPQDGPYSIRKPHGISGVNTGDKRSTPGGSFIDRMRNVLDKTSAAAGCSAEKSTAGKSSSGHGSAWGDTPDTPEMECIAQLERDALRQRLENYTGLAAAATREQAPPPPASAGPRQLTFSPAIAAADPCLNEPFTRPGSSRLRSAQRRQLSHIGRTTLVGSATAAGGAGKMRPLPTNLQPQIETKTSYESLLNKITIGAVRPPELAMTTEESETAIKRQKVENNIMENRYFQAVPNVQGNTAWGYLDSSDDEADEEAYGKVVKDITATANAISAATATTTTTTPPPLELSAYLSPEVAEALLRIGGPRRLYQWQAECVCRPGVLQVGR
jgi:hypothetical protein